MELATWYACQYACVGTVFLQLYRLPSTIQHAKIHSLGILLQPVTWRNSAEVEKNGRWPWEMLAPNMMVGRSWLLSSFHNIYIRSLWIWGSFSKPKCTTYIPYCGFWSIQAWPNMIMLAIFPCSSWNSDRRGCLQNDIVIVRRFTVVSSCHVHCHHVPHQNSYSYCVWICQTWCWLRC